MTAGSPLIWGHFRATTAFMGLFLSWSKATAAGRRKSALEEIQRWEEAAKWATAVCIVTSAFSPQSLRESSTYPEDTCIIHEGQHDYYCLVLLFLKPVAVFFQLGPLQQTVTDALSSKMDLQWYPHWNRILHAVHTIHVTLKMLFVYHCLVKCQPIKLHHFSHCFATSC